MIFLGICIAELISLFFISKVVIRSLAELIYKITKSHVFTVNFLAVLFLPGTIIHELSHMIMAGILFVPVGELEVMPQIQGNDVKLGSVQIGQTDPFRRMLIGVAPLLIGLTLLLAGLTFFVTWQGGFTFGWLSLLASYLVFTIANNMFSSKKDMEGALVFFLTLVITFIFIYLILNFFNLYPWSIISNSANLLNKPSQVSFFKVIGGYLFIPLSIDLVVLVVAVALKKARF